MLNKIVFRDKALKELFQAYWWYEDRKAGLGELFFDEINRCSEKLQNALLQVLEEKRES